MNFGGDAGASRAAVFRLQRLGKRCGCLPRPKTTRRDHSQLTPLSDDLVRLTCFTPQDAVKTNRDQSCLVGESRSLVLTQIDREGTGVRVYKHLSQLRITLVEGRYQKINALALKLRWLVTLAREPFNQPLPISCAMNS